ncbi:MAG: DUF4143 domain-containing protein [Bacteroidales bacterium]|nr:DUF4143 domain-containing protein [Bacteroidales bacterium]
MYPLSLSEILNYYNFTDNLTILQNKPKVLNILENSLKHGTFPEIVLKNSEQIKHEILTNYYDSILIKDCIINKNIRDNKSFKELAFYIFNNLSVLFSYNSLSKATGINDLSVKEYINAMQEAFLIYEISQFSFKIKKQLKSKRKLYTIDNGLITATSLNFSENKGKLFENFVFSELLKYEYNDVFLCNENKECDFIVKKGKQLIAIQATFEVNTKNREREISGLIYAQKKIPVSKSCIVTLSQSEQTEHNIEIIPIYELKELLKSL